MNSSKCVLTGRRAVFTKITRGWNAAAKNYVETARKLFCGTICALVVTGEYHRPAVVMLFDDGSLHECAIDTVAVEGPGEPFR